MKSLKLQLLTSVLSVFMLALILLLIASYNETSHEIEEVFDAELAQTARMISQLTLANIDSKGLDIKIHPATHTGHKYEKHVSYQVWYENALLLRSDSAPDTPLANTSGYSDVSINGLKWRVFALYPESSAYRIYTAEDNKARDELAWEIVIESLEVYLWSLPILAILVFITISRGLASLERLSEDVRAQDIRQLKSLHKDNVPKEVAPLINAINELLNRLESAMQRERRFTSDASHELRTPLSGIKLHAQLAMKADSDHEREHALQQIITAVDQSSRLAEQLLILNRIEPEANREASASIGLRQLCQKIVAEITNSMDFNTAVINVAEHENNGVILIDSNENLLRIIIRNLLDNAVRYADTDAVVQINISSHATGVEITIEDNGPGVPAAQICNLTERFYRAASQDIPGCGLGLAIVAEAVERLQGTLTLENKSGAEMGFRAIVKLPT